jgi:hypothetical protein
MQERVRAVEFVLGRAGVQDAAAPKKEAPKAAEKTIEEMLRATIGN